MLLDEQVLQRMGQGLGWTQGDINSFIGFHYKAITQLIQRMSLKHMVSNDPARIREINDLIQSKDKEDIKKGFKAVQDQIELELTTYPDLKAEIDQYIKEYEEDIFFKFLEIAEVEAVLDLLKYMKTQINNYDRYIDIYKTVEKRVGETKIKEVLGEI